MNFIKMTDIRKYVDHNTASKSKTTKSLLKRANMISDYIR